MRLASLLFVPGDRPDRMEKALSSGADALILDLEDSVSAACKPVARDAVAAFLNRPRNGPRLLVRINPLESAFVHTDIAAILKHRPDGIVLPKAEGAHSLRALDALFGDVACPVLPIAAETPIALFRMGDFAGGSQRLCGLTWGAEDLSASVGAAVGREKDGRYTAPIELARSLTLFAAHAAGVPAIETVYPDFRDLEGLRGYAERGARDGFTGMMAIHPTQVPVINAAFVPAPEAISHARRIIDAFSAAPGAGVLAIDGQMIDAPHFAQARRILDRAAAYER